MNILSPVVGFFRPLQTSTPLLCCETKSFQVSLLTGCYYFLRDSTQPLLGGGNYHKTDDMQRNDLVAIM